MTNIIDVFFEKVYFLDVSVTSNDAFSPININGTTITNIVIQDS